MDVDIKKQDIPSMELGRNFANKIWNAGRFIMMNRDIVYHDDTYSASESSPYINKNHSNSELRIQNSELIKFSFADKWILSRLNETIKNVGLTLDAYKVNDYSKVLYDFIWRDFCDWFIEILKVQLNNSDDIEYKKNLVSFAINVYENILTLLHPVMPFITEEIWHLLNINRNDDESISLQVMPEFNESLIDSKLEDDFIFLQSIVEEIRKLRANVNIPPKQKISVIISCKDRTAEELIETEIGIIKSLAKCSDLQIGLNLTKPDNSLTTVFHETEIFLILDNTIDLEKEKDRLRNEIVRLEKNISGSENKLSNESFVSNAPEDIINYEREKLQSMKDSLDKVKNNLKNL
jgi:valyl-tRNA synthetase